MSSCGDQQCSIPNQARCGKQFLIHISCFCLRKNRRALVSRMSARETLELHCMTFTNERALSPPSPLPSPPPPLLSSSPPLALFSFFLFARSLPSFLSLPPRTKKVLLLHPLPPINPTSPTPEHNVRFRHPFLPGLRRAVRQCIPS